MRLGADKVLVIGLRHKPPANEGIPEESMPFPGAAFLVGKILDAFLLDHIDYDLDRLRRFNAVIEAVRATGSPDHAGASTRSSPPCAARPTGSSANT